MLPKLIEEVGRRLGFEVAAEVEASESAWVDVVWFDKRISFSRRVYRWIFAEAQPRTRVVVMTEKQITEWARNLGVAVAEVGSPKP